MNLVQSVLCEDSMVKSDALRVILEKTILGMVDPKLIDQVANALWECHDFVHHLPAAMIPAIHEQPPKERQTGSIKSQVLYGGCVLVTIPHDTVSHEDFENFHAAPYAHASAHIAIVVAGEGVFFACRHTAEGPALVVTPVRAGSMLFCPAGIEHAFHAGKNGLRVASAQAVYRIPEQAGFAFKAETDFAELPRLSYAQSKEHAAEKEVAAV